MGDRVDLAPLRGQYEGLDRAEVGVMLGRHGSLIDTLAAARPHLTKLFGTDVRIGLSVEPEDGDDETLHATILSRMDDDELLARLERFGEVWWFDRMNPATGRLVFDVGHP